MATANRRLPTQFLFGLLVVFLGFLFLMDTTGFFDTATLWRFVPSLFLLLAGYAIVASDFRNLFGPLVVLSVAGLWQLQTLGLLVVVDLTSSWPLLLVLFGALLLVNQFRPRPAGTPRSHVSSLAVLGGSEKRVTAETFTGADLSAAFGAVSLDLRDADVARPPAHVNVLALFGKTEIYVPREWNVDVDVVPILAGVTDERFRRHDADEETDLVVTGFAAFGGVIIEE